MVTIHVFLFAVLGAIGLGCILGVIAMIKEYGISDVIDFVFMTALSIVGLTFTILSPVIIVYGLTTDVDFKMKNADGEVIERTVKAFEYSRDGNCFQFHDDPNTYCGWEVEYNYKD